MTAQHKTGDLAELERREVDVRLQLRGRAHEALRVAHLKVKFIGLT